MMKSCKEADAIDMAVDALVRGFVVCFPTESTYGLAADARNPQAVALVSALKKRDNPIAVIAADTEQAKGLASVWPPVADELAEKHWPGALTIIVPSLPDLPEPLRGPHGIGVRVSTHPVAHELATRLGAPITATSANPNGLPPAESAAEAKIYFGDQVAVYLDDGPSSSAKPSTVVVISDRGIEEVLRQGPVEV